MQRIKVIVGLRCVVLAATMLLGACGIGPKAPFYSFEFDAREDSPEVEVLDYQYGDSAIPGTRPSAEAIRLHQVGQGTKTYAPMPPADFLYVKWRMRQTGQEFEDRVDLRRRLPQALEGSRVHFVIDGKQLFVYVISRERTTGRCPADPQAVLKKIRPQQRIFLDYCSHMVTQIYPSEGTQRSVRSDE